MTFPEFIAKWRKVELKERSAAQEHFIDLCHLLDHPTPAAADPTGETFCFEKGAAKQGGGDGFADVWKRGFFGWEYKGKHKDLNAAYDQLLRYRSALENPPLLVVCDLDRIVIHTNFTGTVEATHEIPLERLGEPRPIEILRAVFHNPEALRPGRTSASITQDAARHFADIAASMRQRGLDPAAVAHFLDRIVFCLFAEDTALLPDMVFTRIAEKSGDDPARFAKLLGQLFDSMATGGDFGLERIRHFNGNLFDDRTVLDLTPDDLKRIARAAALDWSAVDPSIFGTLFERGLDPAKRAQLGAHFTGREDIELVVDAVVMAPLRREWDETKSTIESLLTTGRKGRDGSVSHTKGRDGSPSRPKNGALGEPAKSPREWHSRGYLPHFDHPGLVQTITFRLADAIPAELASRLAQRRDTTNDAQLRMEIEEALDKSDGACHLRDPHIARIVNNALLKFDGERYKLVAWVIMPNHVHVMIETVPGFRLDEIIHSWKSFTAKECNKRLERKGAFWQEDYYDRFIRDERHYAQSKAYIENNPVKAGLVKQADEWPYGSAGVPPAFIKVATKMVALPARMLKKARSEAASILHGFLVRLQNVRILDPACGSGNFLYVALLRLKDLEKEAILYGNDNGLGSFLPLCGPWQLYGLEINPYAHDLAQMTVWIGWLQWIRVNGFGFPAEPILRPLAQNIRLMDAILAGSASVPPAEEADETSALPPQEPEWPAVDFIIGNPPFLGGSKLWAELGRDYQERLWQLYKDRVPGAADLCCYWFEQARAHIAAGKCKRAGLLATQAIRGGANREVLKRIKESGDIFWAESDRPWILDGANVHVSMVGFDKGEEKSRTLDGKPVTTINANLTARADTTTARPLPSMANLSFIGTKKAGDFNITEDHACELLALPNPHGRPNSDVLKPWINGTAIVQRPAPQWIIDCGENMPLEEFRLYDNPYQHVVSHVKPERDRNNEKRTRENWWLYKRNAPEVRKILSRIPRYIATPRVSKHRIFTWNDSIILPDDGIFIFARADDYFFGVLHSRFHEVWGLAQGTQLREKESGFRYTPTTCFETFPFPGSAGVPPALNMKDAAKMAAPPENIAIAAAAKELNELRENWLNPPEWTCQEILEFPGTVGGPWERYIVPGSAGVPPAYRGQDGRPPIGTVRYPRLVARDADCAARLKDRTLTKLYNERPAWLADCHAKLDAAVAAAYGWPADLPDEQILERLLALNQEAATNPLS